MDDLQRIDDLPGSFGYGAGVLCGRPQLPAWMGAEARRRDARVRASAYAKTFCEQPGG